MTKCEKCGADMIRKSTIITEISDRFNILNYKEQWLYQCSKCKDIIVG